MFHNQAYPSKRGEQLDCADISMPLVWLGDRSWNSLSPPLSLSLHGVRWRILCDRGWNEMCRRSPANLDWLCSFHCFEITDGQSAHQPEPGNTRSDSLFADANVI